MIKTAILAFLLLTGAAAVITFETHYQDRFYPGVFIGGEAVGGRSLEETLSYFQEKADRLLNEGFKISFSGENGARGAEIPAFSAGLTADNSVEYFSLGDWRKTVFDAYNWGRSGPLTRRISEQAILFFGDKRFDFPTAVYDEAVQSLLARELKGFLKEAVPARYASLGGRIVIIEERTGETVNINDVLGHLERNLASLSAPPAVFNASKNHPEVSEEKLAPFLGLVQELADSTSIIFSYNGRRWRVDGSAWIGWLTWRDGMMSVDKEYLERYLGKTVAPSVDNPPKDSRFEMRGGRLVEIAPGKSGNVIDINKTALKVERIFEDVQKAFAGGASLPLAIASVAPQIIFQPKSGEVEIPIEVTESEPKITQKTVDEYGIRDLVGIARTGFKGSSSDRRHNIAQGVKKLTGILLPPDAEFSAVEAIGFVNEEAGFVKEYVIKGDRSVKELGGGLCQIATTLFRLALNSGLPVTERVNHRYVVSYYGPGLDATIYGPHPDLRFVNDTGNYLLLQGKVENDELIFEFYGQRDGRTAHISEPVLSEEKPAPPTKYIPSTDLPVGTTECSETPRKGVTAKVSYTVRRADGSSHEQEFESVYQPWQKICLVGTGI